MRSPWASGRRCDAPVDSKKPREALYHPIYQVRAQKPHPSWVDPPEILICPVAVYGMTFADAVTPTHVKCLADGGFVPADRSREHKPLADERDDLPRLEGMFSAKSTCTT